jgi:hypothetical protein
MGYERSSLSAGNEVGGLYDSIATEVVLLEKSGGNEVFYHMPSMHKTMPDTESTRLFC